MNGILIVDKPQDFTSFDVVAKLRGILGERRLGHGGTLDPLATGVLPVFAGTATRAVDLLPRAAKRYTARIRFGLRTDTGDLTGAVLAEDGRRPARAALEDAAASLLGAGEQIPPMYSAVRVQGKHLYELARAGKTVERAARPIEITRFDILDWDEGAGECTADIACSKGTYIRTLAEDFAARLGCLASLAALRRTESAGYTLRDAHTLAEIERAKADGALAPLLLPVESAFAELPAVRLDDNLARLFLNGFRFEASRLANCPAGRARVLHGDDFLGLGEAREGLFVKVRQFWFPA